MAAGAVTVAVMSGSLRLVDAIIRSTVMRAVAQEEACLLIHV